MQEQFAINLTWRGGYEFSVDFGAEGVPDLLTDEPPPLGEGRGPNPARLLAAAVGNCLSASLKFCLEKSRIEVQELTTKVEGTIVRNEAGRLRIGGLRVQLEPGLDPGQVERAGRCLEIFEEFCIVGQSVRQGIDIDVEVVPRT
ncbi:MAG: OsmC family protein [Longimicrobiales bacterium]